MVSTQPQTTNRRNPGSQEATCVLSPELKQNFVSICAMVTAGGSLSASAAIREILTTRRSTCHNFMQLGGKFV